MRIVGSLFALVLAASLVLMPSAVLAQEGYGGLAKGEWDKVKWQENPNSWHLYLQHWGRTPIQAMSRLAGLCSPDVLCAQLGTNCPGAHRIYGDPNSCWPGGCGSCRAVEEGCLACCDMPGTCEKDKCKVACEALGMSECPVPKCCACNDELVWTNNKPYCAGCWGVSLAFANKSWAGCDISNHPRVNNQHLNHFGVSKCTGGGTGGDWGLSGCPHTESCSLTWCLQDNLCANPLANK